jgi:hypothetical protein
VRRLWRGLRDEHFLALARTLKETTVSKIEWGKPLEVGDGRKVRSPHTPGCPGVEDTPNIALGRKGGLAVLPCPLCGPK